MGPCRSGWVIGGARRQLPGGRETETAQCCRNALTACIDSLTTVRSDVRHRIREYAFSKRVNGEQVLEASLVRGDANVYAAHGSKNGTPFQTSLQTVHSAGLPSDLLIRRGLKALRHGKRAEFAYETYMPSTSHTSFRELKYCKTDAGERTVAFEIEGRTLHGELDDHGGVAWMAFQHPKGGTMRIERIYVRGTP